MMEMKVTKGNRGPHQGLDPDLKVAHSPSLVPAPVQSPLREWKRITMKCQMLGSRV